MQTQRGANSPTLVHKVKKFLLTTYSGRVEMAQEAQDLHLRECLCKVSTQAARRQRRLVWGDERQPRNCGALLSRRVFPSQMHVHFAFGTLTFVILLHVSFYVTILCHWCSGKMCHFYPEAVPSTLPTHCPPSTCAHAPSPRNTDISHLRSGVLSFNSKNACLTG